MGLKLDKYKEIVKKESVYCEIGKVCDIIGLIIEADGPKSSIGDLCHIKTS